ncbi:hypothetical protein GC163_01345 [bacterium]|nr:hypothetical protein [bacterium]
MSEAPISTSPAVKPTLQALLVADHAYSDATTGKKIIAGIFHTIYSKTQALPQDRPKGTPMQLQVPPAGFSMGSPFAYISLINVRGAQPFVLRYVDLGTDVVRFQTDFRVDCQDPLSPVEVVMPLLPLPVDKPGSFALELLWRDESLGTYRIHVKPSPQTPAAPAADSEPPPEAN